MLQYPHQKHEIHVGFWWLMQYLHLGTKYASTMKKEKTRHKRRKRMKKKIKNKIDQYFLRKK
jgi:hypothetical protein